MGVEKNYRIGELALEFDITTRTIRFYEDMGLITPVREGRTRAYTPRDRVRLKLVLRARRLGFPLGEIGEMLNLYDNPTQDVETLHRVRQKIEERRATLEQQRMDIEIILTELDMLQDRCSAVLAQERSAN